MFKRLVVLAAAAVAGWALLGMLRRRAPPDEPFAQFNPLHDAESTAAAGAAIDDEVEAALETPHTSEADLAEQAFVAAALGIGAHHETHTADEAQLVSATDIVVPNDGAQA